MTNTEATDTHPLVTAYHAIFDQKDRLVPGSSASQAAADVLRGLADVLRAEGIDVPERFDARPESVWEGGV